MPHAPGRPQPAVRTGGVAERGCDLPRQPIAEAGHEAVARLARGVLPIGRELEGPEPERVG